MSQQLKQFLADAVDGKNSLINEMSNDPYYKQQCETLIKDFIFTEDSFESDLIKIASILLKPSSNNRYFISLLIFGIHLNIFYSTNCTWYRRDKLVNVLYKIFIDQRKNCINKKCYFRSCTFLLLFGLVIFIIS